MTYRCPTRWILFSDSSDPEKESERVWTSNWGCGGIWTRISLLLKAKFFSRHLFAFLSLWGFLETCGRRGEALLSSTVWEPGGVTSKKCFVEINLWVDKREGEWKCGIQLGLSRACRGVAGGMAVTETSRRKQWRGTIHRTLAGPLAGWPPELRTRRELRRVPRLLAIERTVVAFTENGKSETWEKWRRKYTVINFLLWEARGIRGYLWQPRPRHMT